MKPIGTVLFRLGQKICPIRAILAQTAQGVGATDSFAETAFEIADGAKVTPILITSKDNKNYAVAVQYGKGRIVAVGDSSIAGDGNEFLGTPPFQSRLLFKRQPVIFAQCDAMAARIAIIYIHQ